MNDKTDGEFFDELRRVLHPLYPAKIPTEEEQAENIKKFLLDNLWFQKDRVGVWVGGFIFVDPAKTQTDQLFRGNEPLRYTPQGGYQDAPKAERGRMILPLPYSWSDVQPVSEASEDLLDEMFHCWREAESLLDELGEDQAHPEYYQFLTREDEFVSELIRAFWSGTGCYYSPWGETLFYILGWRLLLRLASAIGCQSEVPEGVAEALGQRAPAFTDLWSESLWKGTNTRERRWCHRIHDLEKNLSTEWRNSVSLKAADNDSSLDAWRRDWITMGLLVPVSGQPESHRFCIGDAMEALRSYCICQSRNDPHLSEAWRSLTLPRPNTGSLEPPLLSNLVMVVEQTILHSLKAKVKTGHAPTIEGCLRQLRETALFPLLPYFYWNVIDPAPRTHMVIPVHHSATSPVSLPWLALDSGGVNGTEVLSDNPTTTIVGVAVVGLRPFSALDWTVSYSESLDSAKAEDDKTRFMLLRDYFELLARPLVDRHFMQRLKTAPNLDHKLRPIYANPNHASKLQMGFRATKGFMFCDISGSSAFMDFVRHQSGYEQHAGPILRDLCTWMAGNIDRAGGIVDKFLGDEVMAYFGASLDSAEPSPAEATSICLAMVKVAIDIHKGFGSEIKEHANKRLDGRFPTTRPNMRTVIGYGEVFWGVLGSEDFMNISILTDNVARAVRIMQHTRRRRIKGKNKYADFRTMKPGEIYVTEAVYRRLGDTNGEFRFGAAKRIKLRSYETSLTPIWRVLYE